MAEPVAWLADFAAALGQEPPTQAEIDDLLALASIAAHASERWAAPLACWLVGRAGVDPATARATADALHSS